MLKTETIAKIKLLINHWKVSQVETGLVIYIGW